MKRKESHWNGGSNGEWEIGTHKNKNIGRIFLFYKLEYAHAI
jgi:hypothetical protein